MNQTLKDIYERKSVRVFEDRAIDKEEKRRILEAAIQAPTAGNQGMFAIIDVTDPELKAKLAETCDHQKFIATAPMVLAFCADYQRWYDAYLAHGEAEVRKPAEGDLMLAFEDTLIAAQNAVVAAQSMGIGSCYIGDFLENYETQKEILNLPKYVVPAVVVVFGYPTEQQRERVKPPRFSVEEVVGENTYLRKSGEEFLGMLQKRQGLEDEAFDRWFTA
ncbi:MAG: nitroreductase family protein, partial [Lachnospiraceae bacterium]|nr:nitroreductase family protein [Lachnospiraceae bacterium]